MTTKFLQNTRYSLSLFILIWIFSIALMVSMTNMGHGWGDDFAAYILQAKSIVQADPERFIKANSFTILQSYATIGPIVYPWGYPLLLAPVYLFFGANIFALKLVAVFFYECFIAVLYFAFVKKNPSPWMWLYLGLFAFNPTMLTAGNEILSDLPFLFFSTLAIALIDYLYRLSEGDFGSRDGNQDWWISALIGICIVMASMMRTNGLLLLPTLAATQLLRFWKLPRHFEWGFKIPSLRTLLPYLLFFILTFLLDQFFPQGGQSHLSELRGIAFSQIWANLKYNLGLLEGFFLQPLGTAIYYFSIPLFIVGLLSKSRQHFPLVAYAVLTLLLYSIWPFRQGIRFLYPILPIFFLFVMYGILKVVELAKGGLIWKVASQILFLIFFGVNVQFLIASCYTALTSLKSEAFIMDGPFGVPAKQMYAFLRLETLPSDVIVFRKPRAMQLMTDRPSLVLNDSKALKLGQYLVLDGEGESKRLRAALKKGDLVGEKIFQNTQFEIYRITNISP